MPKAFGQSFIQCCMSTSEYISMSINKNLKNKTKMFHV